MKTVLVFIVLGTFSFSMAYKGSHPKGMYRAIYIKLALSNNAFNLLEAKSALFQLKSGSDVLLIQQKLRRFKNVFFFFFSFSHWRVCPLTESRFCQQTFICGFYDHFTIYDL